MIDIVTGICIVFCIIALAAAVIYFPVITNPEITDTIPEDPNVPAIHIQMVVDGKMCIFNPQPDITPYESAMMTQLFIVSTRVITPMDKRDKYMTEHNLMRHWTPL